MRGKTRMRGLAARNADVASMRPPQNAGENVTYARRYSIMTILLQ